MMSLHTLFLFTVCLYWKSVNSLSPSGDHVCSTLVSHTETYSVSETYKSSYNAYSCCGWGCWNRCRRTRYRQKYRRVYNIRTVYSRDYVCCPGWAVPYRGSNECTEPVCACRHGTCVGPNQCNCYTGYYGPTCDYTCNTNVANCETVDCTHSSNSRCTQCLYHISDVIKAFNLVNGRCYQVCSWRSDSKTCYPGTCTSGTNCVCDTNFSGFNCTTIDNMPIVSHCSIILQDDSSGNYISTREMFCQPTSSTPVYVSIEGNGLSVNWQTRYTGPSVAQYPFPYYVNDFKVGIISSRVDWEISGDTTATGRIDCSLNHNKDDPNTATHSCIRYGQLSQSLKSGDSLTITAISQNGGYLRLNNYDFSTSPTVSEPFYYSGKTVKRYVKLIVDLEAPTHCTLKEPKPAVCPGNPLEIGTPYTKASEIEVKWSTWMDDESGLKTDPYVCRICKMIATNNIFDSQESCMDPVPSQNGDFYEVEFQPITPGVYCAILGVTDVAGNDRYSRRCFIFDDESSVTIMEDNPLSLTVEEETLNLLETDAWTTGNKDIHISWHGHFSNKLHVEQRLLLAIEANNDIIHSDYDSEANPMGRPLRAITNKNGVVKFEIGVHKDTVGGATFPTFEPTWESLPNDLDESYIDLLDNAEAGDTFGFWVRATDVMGNTKSDYVAIHIDSTSPQFENFESDIDGDGVFEMTAYDRESGIENIYWQLLSTGFKLSLSDGYTLDFNVDGECNPTDCYCILSNKYCYKLVLNVIPTLDKSIHGSVTSALLRVTIKNNALLETTQEMEVTTSHIGPPVSQKADGNNKSGLGVGVAFAVVLLLLVVFLVVFIIRKKNREGNDMRENNAHQNQAYTDANNTGMVQDNAHQNPAFINANDMVDNNVPQTQANASLTGCNPYAVSNNVPPIRPPLFPTHEATGNLGTEYASPNALGITEGCSDNVADNEILPTDIICKGEIVQGNHSVVYRADVPCLALVNVAVKSVKAGNTAGEKETMLHEIEMMRKLPRHNNVVKLLGFTSIRDPVAMVMEFASRGDLTKFLQRTPQTNLWHSSNNSETLSTAQLFTYARNVCCGMQHLQNHKIIHRNLGARNILIDDKMICKITDFGRAVVADADGTYTETQEIQLPVRWTAVEGLRNKIFSMKSDVWSFGVLMWEILSLGSKPYGDKPIKRIAEEVVGGLRLTKPHNCPEEVYSMMESCWHNLMDRRPSFQQLLTDLDKIITSDQKRAFDGDEYIGLDDWQL